MNEIVIIEHFDPENLVPSGVDTILSEIIQYSPVPVSIVGVTNSPAYALGTWREICFSGKQVQFLPVARVDRTVRRPGRPHALVFALGLLRFLHKVRRPNATYHFHRAETGAIGNVLGIRPSVQFIHNAASRLTSRHSDSRWRRLPVIYNAALWFSIRNSGTVLVFNESEANRLRKKFTQVRAGKTWYDSRLFNRLSAKTELSHRHQYVWVGRFESQKDPLLALQVMRELTRLDSLAHLNMVGDGALLNSARDLVDEMKLASVVRFSGALTRAGVAEAMRESCALLMTSHFEGSPTTLVEALACGTPVIATLESDADGLLSGGNVGTTISGRDAGDIARAMIQCTRFDSQACAEAVKNRSSEYGLPRLFQQLGFPTEEHGGHAPRPSSADA